MTDPSSLYNQNSLLKSKSESLNNINNLSETYDMYFEQSRLASMSTNVPSNDEKDNDIFLACCDWEAAI